MIWGFHNKIVPLHPHLGDSQMRFTKKLFLCLIQQ